MSLAADEIRGERGSRLNHASYFFNNFNAVSPETVLVVSVFCVPWVFPAYVCSFILNSKVLNSSLPGSLLSLVSSLLSFFPLMLSIRTRSVSKAFSCESFNIKLKKGL